MMERNIIIWHDVKIKILSKHRSNSDNPLTPESLIEILKLYKFKISAITHVPRQNTPIFYGRLVETGKLTIDVG